MLSEGHTVIGGTAMLSCKVAQTQKEVTSFKDEKKLSANSKVQEETQGHAQRCQGQFPLSWLLGEQLEAAATTLRIKGLC